MTVTDDLDPFVGRAAEVGVLRSEVAAIRSGTPRIVIVQGAAGSGKTTLIENVVAAEVDLAVLWTSGEAWEVSVANGVVDQLMCVAGRDAARPAAVRYRAAPEEPNVLGARILDVLTGLQRAAPVVVVVDDAQWADIGSLRALLFAARRLARQRMLMVFGQRTEDAHRLPAGLHRLACGRTGATVTLGPRPHRPGLGDPSAHRPVPLDRRHRPWDPSLRAAQAFTTHVRGRLDACSHPTQTFVEALVVLGTTDPAAAGIVVGVPDLAAALAEAAAAELLHVRGDFGIYTIDFAHPLVAAAVYERLGPARRLQLHTAVTEFVDAAELPLRRRLLAAAPPNPRLAVELEAFARREIAVGAWATAAWALVESSRLGAEPEPWHQPLLRAVDAALDAVAQPRVFARHVELFTSSAWRAAALGYLALLRGERTEAGELLGDAWRHCVAARSATNGDAAVTATVARRMALHEVGRLRGCEVEAWSRRAIAMARPGDPAREEAEALLGLGIAWQGRIDEGMATYEAMLSRIGPAADGPLLARVRMAHGWLRLIRGDVVEARDALAETAPAALRAGAVQIAVWSFSLLALAEYATGRWDDACTHADRAVGLLDDAGMEWLRPLAHHAAALVPAARGDWAAAEAHLCDGTAEAGDYELMVVAAAMARAEVATARGDHEGVLQALGPLAVPAQAESVEPGLWPGPDLYIDALVSVGKLAEADELLGAFEPQAATRGHAAVLALLARPRGRLLAARGRLAEAEHTFERALATFGELAMPFHRAQVELTYGQALRRAGKRRAAATQLHAAHLRFRDLRATPYLRRCEREMGGCGLTPARRGDFDPHRLTPQERAVARLVAMGMSNRQVAAELFVSVKTVQFHLTHVYTKLGVGSRAELAAHYRK